MAKTLVAGRRLTWDEVHTRLRQEFGKRLDAGFPGLARRSEPIDLKKTSPYGANSFLPLPACRKGFGS